MITYTIDEPILLTKKRVILKSEIPKVITDVLKIVPNENSIIETLVEFVPIFPGCENLISNEEKRSCMSLKIKKFTVKTFDSNKLEELSEFKIQK